MSIGNVFNQAFGRIHNGSGASFIQVYIQ